MLNIQQQALPHVAPSAYQPNVDAARRDNLQRQRIPASESSQAFPQEKPVASEKDKFRLPPQGSTGTAQESKEQSSTTHARIDGSPGDGGERHGANQQQEGQQQRGQQQHSSRGQPHNTSADIGQHTAPADSSAVQAPQVLGDRLFDLHSALALAGKARQAQQALNRGTAAVAARSQTTALSQARPSSAPAESSDSERIAQVVAMRYRLSSQPGVTPSIEQFA